MDNIVLQPLLIDTDDEDDDDYFFNTVFLPVIFYDKDEDVESFILNILNEIIDRI